MSHQQSSWPLDRAFQFDNQIASRAARRTLFVGIVDRDGVLRDPRVYQSFLDPRGHLVFLTTATRN